RVRNSELSRLQLVLEVDRADLVCLEPFDPSVSQLARESKGRTQQTPLRQVYSAWTNSFIRRDTAAAINRASRVRLRLWTSRLRRFSWLVLADAGAVSVVIVKAAVRVVALNQAA